jgi:hypothetical protein
MILFHIVFSDAWLRNFCNPAVLKIAPQIPTIKYKARTRIWNDFIVSLSLATHLTWLISTHIYLLFPPGGKDEVE